MTRRYRDAAALRAALDARLLADSHATGRDPNWTRRRLAFTRLLARLVVAAPGVWVLKGGMAVELRRPGMARATRDVDLVLRAGLVDDPGIEDRVREALVDAVLDDPDNDLFVFVIGHGTRLVDDAYGRPAWRFGVRTMLAGRRFAELRLDVVARPEEIGGTETRPLPDLLGFAGIPPRLIEVSDLRQQYAEKLHALTRTYASGESTRAKDLFDLVLLVDDGVPSDRALVQRVRHVFAIRGTSRVPGTLDRPPEAWRDQFRQFATEVRTSVPSLDAAHQLVAEHWKNALDSDDREQ